MTQLASIDCKVDDDDAVAVLLKSMPEEYDSLITTLKNLPSPTLEGCISALLEEESKIQGHATSTSIATSQAFNYLIQD